MLEEHTSKLKHVFVQRRRAARKPTTKKNKNSKKNKKNGNDGNDERAIERLIDTHMK
jgi:hypothetical protein